MKPEIIFLLSEWHNIAYSGRELINDINSNKETKKPENIYTKSQSMRLHHTETVNVQW